MARDEDVPLFRQIADDLRTRIQEGEFSGTDENGRPKPLPSVNELVSSLGVATATVRKALAVLRAEGLIDTQQGHGTFVRTWRPILRDGSARLSAAHWGQGRSIWSADIDPVERSFEIRSRRIAVVDDAPQQYQDLLRSDRLLLRDRVYIVDGRRVMWARSYLPAGLVAGTAIDKVDTGAGGVFARLAELGCAPARFSEELEARRPVPEEREVLRVPADEPMACLVRMSATDDDRIVDITDMRAVGAAYRFRWTFTS